MYGVQPQTYPDFAQKNNQKNHMKRSRCQKSFGGEEALISLQTWVTEKYGHKALQVGSVVGATVGSDVGVPVGPDVGATVGSAVGKIVGTDVGATVGLEVGAGVGISTKHDVSSRVVVPLTTQPAV